MGAIGCDIYLWGDMSPGNLAKATNMLRAEVNASNGQIMKDLEEIRKLNYNEESRLELEGQIGELKDRIAISGENMEKKSQEQKNEL